MSKDSIVRSSGARVNGRTKRRTDETQQILPSTDIVLGDLLLAHRLRKDLKRFLGDDLLLSVNKGSQRDVIDEGKIKRADEPFQVAGQPFWRSRISCLAQWAVEVRDKEERLGG